VTALTKAQMVRLLGVCARFDGRTLDSATFESWYQLLADIPYEDIEDAIAVHYRASVKWIMPAHIVAHHEQLAAGRRVEAARQSPPGCWGCDQTYRLSARPGSPFALPDGPHDQSCRALQGVLVFDGDGGWSVMAVDPDSFDEVLWEQHRQAVAGKRAAWLELEGGGSGG
jgi:hypothetical protein